MTIHFVGGNGRVHALVNKFAQSPKVTKVICAPGNPGIGMETLQNGETVLCVPVSPEDIHGQLALARACGAGLSIVSEDDPLALGIVDLFQSEGLRIWGPSKKAAKFEWSKVWAHKFMEKHGIPTPFGKAFDNGREALTFAHTLNFECAVKVDGLARGRGVLICHTYHEVTNALCRIFLRKEFGNAGRRVLIQKLVFGPEMSLHFLCNGTSAIAFPSSKDHKRAKEGEKGEMTGGMGAVSPSPDIEPAECEKLAKNIIEAWREGCREEGIDFRGILYPCLKFTDEGPVVLEFNARFGDPEAQVYLTRLQSDLLHLVEESLEGCILEPPALQWDSNSSVCVVMVSPGYPGPHSKGKKITCLEKVAHSPGVKVFHGATSLKDGRFLTNGGRVLGVTALGATLEEARKRAYCAVDKIRFEGGKFVRRDIGGQALM